MIFWTFLANAVAENRVASPLTETAESITGVEPVGIILCCAAAPPLAKPEE